MAIDVVTPPKTNKMSSNTNTTNNQNKPRLLHDTLHQIPVSVRFPISGTISNALFLVGYNLCVEYFENDMKGITAARIYSIVYVLFIPIAHALSSLIVFGWPSPYLPNLISNSPIGLSAMVIGTFCTGYFDKIELESTIDTFFVNVGIATAKGDQEDGSNNGDQFYCSLIVMAITGIWSYLLAVYINTPSSSDGKKDPKKEL